MQYFCQWCAGVQTATNVFYNPQAVRILLTVISAKTATSTCLYCFTDDILNATPVVADVRVKIFSKKICF